MRLFLTLILKKMPLRKVSQPPCMNDVCEENEDHSDENGSVRRKSSTWYLIEPSRHAVNTINSVRAVVDAMAVKPNPQKSLIQLHLGDPTLTGVLSTHKNVNEAILDVLHKNMHNGLDPPEGSLEARRAVAEYASTLDCKINPNDVILTSGCSHAIQIAIEVLAEPGTNILVPSPGFPLYETLMRSMDAEPAYYDLLPDQNWEIDLEEMASLIDDKTVAILINNPNNPTGGVHSKKHLQDILTLAESYRIPIIADEIYGDMVFGGAEFHPLHTLQPKVPVLTCDGIGKRFLVPGWRLGWLIIHDVHGSLSKVKSGLLRMMEKFHGPCSLIQGALPSILHRTPPEFFQQTRDIVSQNVDVVCSELETIPGIRPIRPHGALYMLISIDMDSFPGFESDLSLIQALIKEESLYCLPGSVFYYPDAVRFVMANPIEAIKGACERLRSFSKRHYKKPGLEKGKTDEPAAAAARRRSDIAVGRKLSMIAVEARKRAMSLVEDDYIHENWNGIALGNIVRNN